MEPWSSTLVTNPLHFTIFIFRILHPVNYGKSQLVRVHAMKAYEWSRGTALLILILGTRWRELSVPRLGRFIPVERAANSHCKGWMSPRARLDPMEKCFSRFLSPYPSHYTYWAIAVPSMCVASYCSPGFTIFTAACCLCCSTCQTTSPVTGVFFKRYVLGIFVEILQHLSLVLLLFLYQEMEQNNW
jgi:hypothetical protein